MRPMALRTQNHATHQPRPGQVGVAVCVVEVRSAGAEVQLTPAGAFRARDGRPAGIDAWRMDRDIAARVIARAAARRTPLHIDYEHQTLHAADNGQPAPRAATFTKLEWREGSGLFAVDVAWTARAKGYIEAGEYGYISPVFLFDKQSGAVLEVLHAALTNDPALDGMSDVVARAAAKFSTQEDIEMNDELLKLLGLTADATDEQIATATTALKKKIDDAEAAAASAKTKQEQAEAALAAASSNKDGAGAPDPAKYVPIEDVKALQKDLAALKSQMNDSAVDALVTAAIDEGKLLPKQEKWARDLGKSDLAALKAYIDDAEPIAALKGTQTGGRQPGGNGKDGLSETEIAVCKQLGISEDEYKKTREQQAAA